MSSLRYTFVSDMYVPLGKAVQSSTMQSYGCKHDHCVADKAVDSDLGTGSNTQKGSDNQWWAVELLENTRIAYIQLFLYAGYFRLVSPPQAPLKYRDISPF